MKQVRSLPLPPFMAPGFYSWYVFRWATSRYRHQSWTRLRLLGELDQIYSVVDTWDPTSLWEWKVQRGRVLAFGRKENA